MLPPQINSSTLIECVQKFLPLWKPIFNEATYETKGVLFSEMAIIAASARLLKAQNIYESGRARGISTYLLSRLLPDCQIISYELSTESEDVPYARKRLEGLPNVRLEFGNASQCFPKMVGAGDLVFIDGPKHFRALRLAFDLLSKNGSSAVFLHDTFLGSVERNFLEQYVPGCLYSDRKELVRALKSVDEKCWQYKKMEKDPHLGSDYGPDLPDRSYGPTLACLLQVPSQSLGLCLTYEGLLNRLKNSVRKRLYAF
jgi:predicted O-methyltransferase YrrM